MDSCAFDGHLGYEHDGKTTYCWRIPQSFQVKIANWTDDVLEGQGQGCAVSMALSFQNTTEVVVGVFVPVTWNVTVNLALLGDANAVNETALFTTLDESTHTQVQVIHSNIHSCQFGSNCDPFRLGTDFVDNTPNQVGNFTNDRIVFTSTDDLVYNEPGLYSVLAHIILPGATDDERFDFAVYQRLTVVAASDARSSSSSAAAAMSSGSSGSGSLSSAATVVLIVGILAVVLIAIGTVLWIRNKRRPPPSSSSCDMSSGQSTFASMGGNTPTAPKPRLMDEFESEDDSVFAQIAVLEAPKLQAPRNSMTQRGSEAQQRINRLPLIYRDMSSVSEDSDSFAFHPGASRGTSRSERKIVSTNNSVDFVYPDTDMSLDIVDTGYTEELRDQKKTYISSDSMDSVGSSDSYAGFVVQGDWVASNRVFDGQDSSVSERYRVLQDTELYGHDDVEI